MLNVENLITLQKSYATKLHKANVAEHLITKVQFLFTFLWNMYKFCKRNRQVMSYLRGDAHNISKPLFYTICSLLRKKLMNIIHLADILKRTTVDNENYIVFFSSSKICFGNFIFLIHKQRRLVTLTYHSEQGDKSDLRTPSK